MCEGLNVLVWHAFVCSPEETGIPGQQYFAGTHLNPKVTWWEKSSAFFSYVDRCQWMLQQGNFGADVLYYYGDHVPNFTQHKHTDPAHVQPGYDYDVITEEALIERASVKDGKIFLPDGIHYRVLVLPDRDVISLPALKKIKELVAAGATVVGPKPARGETLDNFAATDAEVKALADELWSGARTAKFAIGQDRPQVVSSPAKPRGKCCRRTACRRTANSQCADNPQMDYFIAPTAERKFISSPTAAMLPRPRRSPFA